MKRLLRALPAVAALWSAGAVGAQDIPTSQVDRGRYLAQAGNCTGCHTSAAGEMAGGYVMHTPMGEIASANITFDVETGIGAWTRDDFDRAMRRGVRKDGAQIYPAMPYPHFRRMPRADVDAIYDYLRTLPAVRNEVVPEEGLIPLLQFRYAVKGWNLLNFTPGMVADEPARDRAWNLGRHLVEGPGHCAGCHTPKDITGGDVDNRHLAGGTVENWHAPSIRAGEGGALAAWSEAEIAEYLRTGRNDHAVANRRMGQVIQNSTQHLNDEDLAAIAVYLKTLEGGSAGGVPTADAAAIERGKGIYFDNCAACHRTDGEGVPRIFPRLAGGPAIVASDPTSLIRVVLEGSVTRATKAEPGVVGMPAFHWKLSDGEIADVLSYVRGAWGNAAAPVAAGEVGGLRGKLAEEWGAVLREATAAE